MPPAAATERPVWMQDLIDRAGGTERAIAALAILVIAIIAIIWLLASLLGGGDGEQPQPTATAELQVLPIGEQGTAEPTTTPSVEGGADSVATSAVNRDLLVTPTSRGSDNMLDGTSSTPAAEIQEPTATCGDACLARVERTPEAPQVLAANGTRPSYSAEDWYWVVAEPKEIEAISTRLDTTVIRESDETLRLYMVMLPSEAASDDEAKAFGSVLDSVENYRLVETDRAPANVRSVINAGLTVEKVAPAPPKSFSRPADRQTLNDSNIGGLPNGIDADRIEAIITDLQASGSNDGTGIGTRHYRTVGNQIAAEYLFRALESYGLDVWYEDFVSWDGLLLVNVVGELPGKDTSRLYGVMAHLDTTSDKPGTVAPGADDNASGIAATLEIARLLADFDLKYSFRVVFINYEEEGVVGSGEFAKQQVADKVPWEGIFNIDSIGSARNGDLIVLNTDKGSAWMADLMQRVNDAYGLGQQLEILQDPDIVADDTRLRANGLESVLVARELFGWSPVHHTADDVVERVSVEKTIGAANLVLLSVASLMI